MPSVCEASAQHGVRNVEANALPALRLVQRLASGLRKLADHLPR